MKRYMIFLIAALILVACGGNGSLQQDVLSTPPAISVTITRDYCPSLEVKVGMQVAWTNGDTVQLPLQIDGLDANGNVVDTGKSEIAPGDIFSTRFYNAGTYRFYCSDDRNIYGTITVK